MVHILPCSTPQRHRSCVTYPCSSPPPSAMTQQSMAPPTPVHAREKWPRACANAGRDSGPVPSPRIHRSLAIAQSPASPSNLVARSPSGPAPRQQEARRISPAGLSTSHCLTVSRVELRGFEPLTSSMPWKRATNCAIAPCRVPPAGDSSILPRVPIPGEIGRQVV